MTFGDVTKWAEKNPIPTFGIIVVGGLLVLWILGYFSNSGGATNANNSNALDAAYFGAVNQESGNQTALAIAQLQASRDEALATTNANAAVAITQSKNQLGMLQSNNALQANYDTVALTTNEKYTEANMANFNATNLLSQIAELDAANGVAPNFGPLLATNFGH